MLTIYPSRNWVLDKSEDNKAGFEIILLETVEDNAKDGFNQLLIPDSTSLSILHSKINVSLSFKLIPFQIN